MTSRSGPARALDALGQRRVRARRRDRRLRPPRLLGRSALGDRPLGCPRRRAARARRRPLQPDPGLAPRRGRGPQGRSRPGDRSLTQPLLDPRRYLRLLALLAALAAALAAVGYLPTARLAGATGTGAMVAGIAASLLATAIGGLPLLLPRAAARALGDGAAAGDGAAFPGGHRPGRGAGALRRWCRWRRRSSGWRSPTSCSSPPRLPSRPGRWSRRGSDPWPAAIRSRTSSSIRSSRPTPSSASSPRRARSPCSPIRSLMMIAGRRCCCSFVLPRWVRRRRGGDAVGALVPAGLGQLRRGDLRVPAQARSPSRRSGVHTDRFIKYIWSVFFFVLTVNLLGLLPIPAISTLFGAHLGGTATGNIWVTATLALDDHGLMVVQRPAARRQGTTSRTSARGRSGSRRCWCRWRSSAWSPRPSPWPSVSSPT